MNGINMLIFTILALGMAATGAILFLQTGQTISNQPIQDLQKATPTIVQVIATNISNGTANYVRIQVTSDEPVYLTDTTIMLTESQTATLRYRNGTLTRDVTNGFYTQ